MSIEKHHKFLFYSETIADQTLILNPDEVGHLNNVLKYDAGQEIAVADGKGNIYTCKVEQIKKSNALCSIISKEFIERPTPLIHVFAGVPDKERFERMCECLPPLNVASITPLVTDHSQKAWWTDKWSKASERFHRVIVSSQKQSFNPYLTEIKEPTKFEDALNNASGNIIFGDFEGKKFNSIKDEISKDTINLFIGPPSGFSEKEIQTLKDKNAFSLWLGIHRLRTELASITMASLLTQIYE